MEPVEIVFDPLPPEALSKLISENISGWAQARTGLSDWSPANFFLKNPRGEWLGGLLGFVWGGWLFVRFLWVAEQERGKGHGTRLLQAAESLARDHGAKAVTLETHSFEAPDFYRKLGYEVFGQLDDCPPGHTRFYLTRRLDG